MIDAVVTTLPPEQQLIITLQRHPRFDSGRSRRFVGVSEADQRMLLAHSNRGKSTRQALEHYVGVHVEEVEKCRATDRVRRDRRDGHRVDGRRLRRPDRADSSRSTWCPLPATPSSPRCTRSSGRHMISTLLRRRRRTCTRGCSMRFAPSIGTEGSGQLQPLGDPGRLVAALVGEAGGVGRLVAAVHHAAASPARDATTNGPMASPSADRTASPASAAAPPAMLDSPSAAVASAAARSRSRKVSAPASRCAHAS